MTRVQRGLGRHMKKFDVAAKFLGSTSPSTASDGLLKPHSVLRTLHFQAIEQLVYFYYTSSKLNKECLIWNISSKQVFFFTIALRS